MARARNVPPRMGRNGALWAFWSCAPPMSAGPRRPPRCSVGGSRAPGQAVPVSSAGLLPGGSPALPEMRAVMDGYGADLAGHVSRTVAVPDLAGAALVIAMAREHLRHAVVLAPGCWPVAFTLKELLRRGERAGPRRPGETVSGWLARVHEGREKQALLGASPEDDVPDPAGGPPEGYAATAGLLDRLTARLAGLCWAVGDGA